MWIMSAKKYVEIHTHLILQIIFAYSSYIMTMSIFLGHVAGTFKAHVNEVSASAGLCILAGNVWWYLICTKEGPQFIPILSRQSTE